MIRFLSCNLCNQAESEERNSNFDLKYYNSHKVKETPFRVKSSNQKPNLSSSLNDSFPFSTSKLSKFEEIKSKDENEESELSIIEYPYESKLVIEKSIATKNEKIKKNVSYLNVNISEIEKNIDNNSLIEEDLSDEPSKNYENTKNSKENYSKGDIQNNNKYCIYCEEIYKNAFTNGYIIQEKQCIYCNKIINQKTFDELYGKEAQKINEVEKEDVSIIINKKSKSSARFKKLKKNITNSSMGITGGNDNGNTKKKENKNKGNEIKEGEKNDVIKKSFISKNSMSNFPKKNTQKRSGNKKLVKMKTTDKIKVTKKI